MPCLKFIGKFKDLKALGFERQSLYSDNKIVYSKEHMFIYKSGSSVSNSLCLDIDKIYQMLIPLFGKSDFDFSQLVERNKKLDKDFGINDFIHFFVSTDGFATLDKTEYIKEQQNFWSVFNKAKDNGETPDLKPLVWQRASIPILELDVLKLLHDNKMIA